LLSTWNWMLPNNYTFRTLHCVITQKFYTCMSYSR
jgi:hypothetical protein